MAQQTKSGSNRSTKSGASSRSSTTRSSKARSSSNGRSTAKPRSSSRSQSSRSTTKKASTRKSGASKRPSPASRSRSSSQSRSSTQSKGPVEQAKDATVETAQSAGNGIATAAKKLKTPALAAGAGIAGLAGGLALSQRARRSKVLGVPMPKLNGAKAASKNVAEAAKQVGSFAEKAGELATEIRTTREAIEHNGKRRSPIEVVLQGLTARR